MTGKHDFTGSVLTPSQREFLMEGPDEEQSPSAPRMARSRIRKRLGAAIIDFSILIASDEFDADDIAAAFTSEVDAEYRPIPTDLVQEAIAVIFLGSRAREGPLDTVPEDHLYIPEKFIEELRKGIERAVSKAGQTVTDCQVDIQIEIEEESPPDNSAELHRLPVDRLERLHLANYITEQEYVTAMVKRYQTPPVGEDGIEE